MKISSNKILLLIVVFLIFNSFAFAEKIHLKNGKIIEGKIIEEKDNYIKIEEVQGIPTTYFKDEITNMEGKDSTQKSASSFGEHPDIQKYKELIQKEPNNYEHYLGLAGLYASTGDGDLVLENVEKALQLDSKAAISKDAYMIAAMGAYYAGEFKKSYEYTEKALQANPEHKIAKSFKDMLESVSKQQWSGKFPEKTSWHGYKSAGELGRAMAEKGTVNLGDKEDRFASNALNFKVRSPAGWLKESFFKNPDGDEALLFYSKSKGDFSLPMMFITRDFADIEDKTALDFSLKIKRGFLTGYPQMSFNGPEEVMINGKSASRMDFGAVGSKGELRTEWYQFLHKGVIITFQYINLGKDFESLRNVFKELVNSFLIEES